MKKGIWRVVAIACLVVAGLWVLQYLPAFTLLGHRLEPVRLLSAFTPAVATDTTLTAVADSTPCPEGVVCIDDFAGTQSHGMHHFYKALQALKKQPERKVRIAFYGDSFIEADILTSELRKLLQNTYGGEGVGFLPMRSDRNDKYRNTVALSQAGWREFEMVSPKADASQLGIAGLYLHATPQAYTEVQAKPDMQPQTWEQHLVYYSKGIEQTMPEWRCEVGESTLPVRVTQHGSVCVAQAEQRTNRVRWQLQATTREAAYWGMSIEGKGGIVLDNFSMRGETGLSLSKLSAARLADFQAARPYDLIILQYGLNIVTNKQMESHTYFEQMRVVVATLKQAFPTTSILVFGISDRAQRQHGTYATMPNLLDYAQQQRQWAADEGLAYWDTYAAMQYDGGIVGFVNATPRCAALDYTHVNHAGGARIAKHLYAALNAGLARYESHAQ